MISAKSFVIVLSKCFKFIKLVVKKRGRDHAERFLVVVTVFIIIIITVVFITGMITIIKQTSLKVQHSMAMMMLFLSSFDFFLSI